MCAAAVAMLSLTACSDDSNDSGSGDDGSAKVDTVVSTLEQKKKLDSVAVRAMNLTPAEDFQNIYRLTEDMLERTAYNSDDIDEWFTSTLQALSTLTSETKTETDRHTEDGHTGVYYDVFRNYNALIAISNLNGHFTADEESKKWTRTDADDLQIFFEDRDGKECVLKVAGSGATKNVYLSQYKEWDEAGEEGKFKYDEEEVTDELTNLYKYFVTTQITMKVPEHITLSLSQDGKTVMTTDLHLSLGDLADGQYFSLRKTSVTLNAKTTLNDYVFDLKQFAYDANKSAAVQLDVYKGSTRVYSFDIASDLTGIPDFIHDGNHSISGSDFDDVNVQNAVVKIDILGEVQIQGTVQDLEKYLDCLNSATDNDTDEATFKSFINQANSMMDINVYYDNKSTKQASLMMRAFDYDYDGHSVWYDDPVICFPDGSGYSLETFFSEEDFRKSLDKFEELIEGFRNLR